MLTLTQVISRVANRLNKNASDTTVAARLKNHINDVCQEKWHGYAWSFRYKQYPLVLTAQVSSGTLTATNGSRTVTASGTPFVAAKHVGAWIQFPQDTIQAWYRIITVSSTSSVIIEPAYQGTTGSSKTYVLCKTDYTLPTEVSDISNLKVTMGNRNVSNLHQFYTDLYDQPTLAVGTPEAFSVLNSDQTRSTYSTGTLSGTINTRVLTGSGTSWLDNVYPGDDILITGDSNTYRVLSVDSDTQITLYNNLVVAASGVAYTISRQFGKVLRVTPCPDYPYVIFVKGLRDYTPLVNNADSNEFLVRYPHAVIEGAVWREASSSPDPREDSLYMKSEKLWIQAQSEDEMMQPVVNHHPIWNPRAGGC